MFEAELMLDAKVLLGEGPWWNAKTQQLYWVDIEGCAVHIFDPATGQDRKIEVGQMVGCVVGRKSSRPQGEVLVALQNGFYNLDLETEALTLLVDPESHLPENRFNDGKCDSRGRLWAGTTRVNHDEPEVVDHVVGVMCHWLDRGADGWRLDAAYAVPGRFWAKVLPRVRERHPDAWFVGEVIHGDYAAMVTESGFDAVTQYELWKATWSALNDGNFHELDHALGRHAEFLETFVPQTFVGNHDVTRIASRLADPRHVPHALVLLMTIGGVPTIYAGDEFGLHGVKEERVGGDDAVRPEFGAPPMPVDDAGAQLFALHQFLIGLRRRHAWLHRARTTALHLDNRCYVYETRCGDESLVVALSVSDTPVPVRLPAAATVIAGSGAPPEQTLTDLVVPPHGWRVAAPH